MTERSVNLNFEDKMSSAAHENTISARETSINKITDSALVLFAEKGFYSTTINDIALKAGISKGLMYNYFKSKEELLDAIILPMLEVNLNLKKMLKAEADPKEILIGIIKNLESVMKQRPEYWKLQTTLALQPGIFEKYNEKLKDTYEETIKEFRYLFVKAGSKDPELDTAVFLAAFKGLQLFFLYTPGLFSLEKTAAHLLDNLLGTGDKQKRGKK